MRVMVIGSGGREFSIGRVLKQDPEVTSLYFAPGNGATSMLGTNVSLKEYEELAQFALDNSIDLTIVGPEGPLSDGVVDVFKAKGLVIFGPSKARCATRRLKSLYEKLFG